MAELICLKGIELSSDLAEEIKEISICDSRERLAEIIETGLRCTLESVMRMAAAVHRFEEIGGELADLPRGIGQIVADLRRIAWGQMSPHLFVSCMGRPNLLAKARRLPIPDQELIADNQSIAVLSPNCSDHRMIPALELSEQQVKQVIGHDGIRTLSGQRSFIEDENRRRIASGFEPPDVGFEIDKKRRRIVFVRNTILTIKELQRVLEELKR